MNCPKEVIGTILSIIQQILCTKQYVVLDAVHVTKQVKSLPS